MLYSSCWRVKALKNSKWISKRWLQNPLHFFCFNLRQKDLYKYKKWAGYYKKLEQIWGYYSFIFLWEDLSKEETTCKSFNLNQITNDRSACLSLPSQSLSLLASSSLNNVFELNQITPLSHMTKTLWMTFNPRTWLPEYHLLCKAVMKSCLPWILPLKVIRKRIFLDVL